MNKVVPNLIYTYTLHPINRFTSAYESCMNRSYIGTYDNQMRIATTMTATTATTRARKGEGEEGRKKCLAGRRAKRVSDFADFKVGDDRYFPSRSFVGTRVKQTNINLFKFNNNTIVFITQIDRSKYV